MYVLSFGREAYKIQRVWSGHLGRKLFRRLVVAIEEFRWGGLVLQLVLVGLLMTMLLPLPPCCPSSSSSSHAPHQVCQSRGKQRDLQRQLHAC